MAGDEFKHVGKYFAEGEYESLPITRRPADWTLEGWFIWLGGDGPLIAADDEDWAWGWVYDSDDSCAYRIGGVERLTSVPVESVREHWLYVAVAKDAGGAMLWLNDGRADHWVAVPLLATLSNAVAMKHALGFAADIAYYDRRLPDDRLDAHWQAGKRRV